MEISSTPMLSLVLWGIALFPVNSQMVQGKWEVKLWKMLEICSPQPFDVLDSDAV